MICYKRTYLKRQKFKNPKYTIFHNTDKDFRPAIAYKVLFKINLANSEERERAKLHTIEIELVDEPLAGSDLYWSISLNDRISFTCHTNYLE